jgi:hypothetical protein
MVAPDGGRWWYRRKGRAYPDVYTDLYPVWPWREDIKEERQGRYLMIVLLVLFVLYLLS